jgi:hypothetical protein
LRRRIKSKAVEKDFAASLARALELSMSDEANYLPGWCAAHPRSAKTCVKKTDADAPAGPPKTGNDD